MAQGPNISMSPIPKGLSKDTETLNPAPSHTGHTDPYTMSCTKPNTTNTTNNAAHSAPSHASHADPSAPSHTEPNATHSGGDSSAGHSLAPDLTSDESLVDRMVNHGEDSFVGQSPPPSEIPETRHHGGSKKTEKLPNRSPTHSPPASEIPEARQPRGSKKLDKTASQAASHRETDNIHRSEDPIVAQSPTPSEISNISLSTGGRGRHNRSILEKLAPRYTPREWRQSDASPSARSQRLLNRTLLSENTDLNSSFESRRSVDRNSMRTVEKPKKSTAKTQKVKPYSQATKSARGEVDVTGPVHVNTNTANTDSGLGSSESTMSVQHRRETNEHVVSRQGASTSAEHSNRISNRSVPIKRKRGRSGFYKPAKRAKKNASRGFNDRSETSDFTSQDEMDHQSRDLNAAQSQKDYEPRDQGSCDQEDQSNNHNLTKAYEVSEEGERLTVEVIPEHLLKPGELNGDSSHHVPRDEDRDVRDENRNVDKHTMPDLEENEPTSLAELWKSGRKGRVGPTPSGSNQNMAEESNDSDYEVIQQTPRKARKRILSDDSDGEPFEEDGNKHWNVQYKKHQLKISSPRKNKITSPQEKQKMVTKFESYGNYEIRVSSESKHERQQKHKAISSAKRSKEKSRSGSHDRKSKPKHVGMTVDQIFKLSNIKVPNAQTSSGAPEGESEDSYQTTGYTRIRDASHGHDTHNLKVLSSSDFESEQSEQEKGRSRSGEKENDVSNERREDTSHEVFKTPGPPVRTSRTPTEKESKTGRGRMASPVAYLSPRIMPTFWRTEESTTSARAKRLLNRSVSRESCSSESSEESSTETSGDRDSMLNMEKRRNSSGKQERQKARVRPMKRGENNPQENSRSDSEENESSMGHRRPREQHVEPSHSRNTAGHNHHRSNNRDLAQSKVKNTSPVEEESARNSVCSKESSKESKACTRRYAKSHQKQQKQGADSHVTNIASVKPMSSTQSTQPKQTSQNRTGISGIGGISGRDRTFPPVPDITQSAPARVREQSQVCLGPGKCKKPVCFLCI